MDVLLEQFKDYLTTEKHASDNTVTSYVRDVSAFCAAAHLHTEKDCTKVKSKQVEDYLYALESPARRCSAQERR